MNPPLTNMFNKPKGLKPKMVSKCCRSPYHMKLGRMTCSLCSKPCNSMRDDGERPNRPERSFAEYKPPYSMSVKDRNEEILKRTSIVSEYTNSLKGLPADERLFTEERIKWNNDRIALLLG